MNQIMIGATVSLLLIGGVTGCASVESTASSNQNQVRINLPRCTLAAAKTSGDCIVKVFDGNALAAAQRSEQGEWFITVPTDTVTGPRISVFSAPGYEPQIQALKINVRDDEQIVLKPRIDTRGGYLTGVVFKKTEEKMASGVCGIENFLANKPVVVNRARARFTTSTDNLGSFQMELPAGRYAVEAEGQSREVDVPHNDTLFVVMPIN
ncbi:MAG: hypothetical protein HY273_13960 [Gammaproteobacteria bacterium]|nr:hypothetical protein [Gammaproteobacteria bacterium]